MRTQPRDQGAALLHRTDLDSLRDSSTHEQVEAEQTIKECDKRIANFEIACGASDDPETIAGFARRIESARSERKGAEVRLRRVGVLAGVETVAEFATSAPDVRALWTDSVSVDAVRALRSCHRRLARVAAAALFALW